jgi:hypothetical protein
MVRICGIEKKALREGEPGCKLRLAAGDAPGIEPGLYFCSLEAYERFAPRVLERLKRTPQIHHDGKPALDGDGKPAMTVPENATLTSIDPRLLQ